MSIGNLAWEKMGGLIPAIVQDSFDGRVLMQGYMNQKAQDLLMAAPNVADEKHLKELHIEVKMPPEEE